jgi:hypothetical protein
MHAAAPAHHISQLQHHLLKGLLQGQLHGLLHAHRTPSIIYTCKALGVLTMSASCSTTSSKVVFCARKVAAS